MHALKERSSGMLVLRVLMGVTFIWIGVLIVMDPAGWGALIAPWAESFVPGDIETVMLVNGILDIAVGAALLFGLLTWIAAWLGALHLVSVLAVTGVTGVTVRDIGLLGGCLALALETMPDRFRFWKKS